MTTKRCRGCGFELPLDNFYKRQGVAQSRCKDCHRADMRLFWVNRTPEQSRKRDVARRRWIDKNPDYNKFIGILRRYKITLDQYAAMEDSQQSLCAICGDYMDTPHIDHNHATGKFRGLLCFGCNPGLGNFRDDPKLLKRGIAYLLARGNYAQAYAPVRGSRDMGS